VLGAGYDTFAVRQPDWARVLRIFEVDHAASQQAKRDRLAAANIPVPSNVTFAAVDFEHETLVNGLLRSGFDLEQPAFVSCLGVLVYLTAEAVEGVFRFAASLTSGSEIVATFRARPGEDEAGESPVGTAAAAAGEPWISNFDPDALLEQLRRMGFSDVSLITGPELEVRYALRRTDGLHPPRRMTMVSAKV
jgi:methyltransferase (TIGR00027 family)